MAPSLGGSLIVRDAIKYDYPVLAALESLSDLCDDVVVGECGSEDETLELISQWVRATGRDNVTILEGMDWFCDDGRERLSKLTTQTASHLRTDYHFNLQADEVVHERSFPHIRAAINTGGPGFHVRRYNLWGAWNSMIRLDLEGRKPVSDVVCRLAMTKYPSYGDGESLNAPAVAFIPEIEIYHLGFIRDPKIHPGKIVHMQRDVFGIGPDPRAVRAESLGERFNPYEYFSSADLEPTPPPLPRCAAQWALSRSLTAVG